MRLLDTRSLNLVELNENEFIAYAILSHTWESEEVTFQDMQLGAKHAASKAGYAKIVAACKQAREEGWQYIWIDTCCINKSSSTELTEAINCM
jgi:Heterokaryon incompatibility protein (HET)